MKTRLFLPILSIFCIFCLVQCKKDARVPAELGTNAEIKRCLELSTQKKYKKAIECLEIFKSRFPDSDRSNEADLLIGDNHFSQKEYLLAAEAYQEFLNQNPFHARQDYAYYRAGQAYFLETPKAIDRDQSYLNNSLKSYEMVVRYYPNSPYHRLAEEEYAKARTKLAKHNYYIGNFYYKYGEYLASIPRFQKIINEFPKTGFDEKSYFYLVKALLKTKQPDVAKMVVQAFSQRYPNSPLYKKVKRQLKV